MKVIKNTKLLKKLQPYLNKNTEFIINYSGEAEKNKWTLQELESVHYLKTLTLEEAIDLLPIEIVTEDGMFGLQFVPCGDFTTVEYGDDGTTFKIVEGETLLEAVEQMLEYLIDNNLIKDEK